MTREIPSAQVWFAGGERIGYDAVARAIVRGPGAPLSVFLKCEGDLAHAMSFLPGFSDGVLWMGQGSVVSAERG